jgi:hypothetical protein
MTHEKMYVHFVRAADGLGQFRLGESRNEAAEQQHRDTGDEKIHSHIDMDVCGADGLVSGC